MNNYVRFNYIMPGRQQIPSFQIASGTTAERDNSYNIPTGSIFFNTDTSNIELSGNVVVAGKILPSANTSNIELSGNVVFSEPPQCSTAPTTNDQLANKSYVDSQAGTPANMMTTDTAQTITGLKTFTTLPQSSVVPTSANDLTNRTYVGTFLSKAGGTMTGDLRMDDTHIETKRIEQIDSRGISLVGGSSGTAGGLTILNSGYVEIDNRMGIGTTTPSYPLHIHSTIALGNTGSYGYLRPNQQAPAYYSSGWQTYGVSLYTNGLMVANNYVLASDERIKRDITDLSNSIKLVEQIKPKKYKYKDPKQGETIDYGFVAQELEEVLPCAVNTMRDKIPNILQPADVSNQIFTLKEATDLQEGDDLHIYDEDDKAHEVKITEIIDDKTFKTNIADREGLKDKYFVYGKFVDDFKTIEHKCLIPVLMKAVQELNEKVEALESQIKTQ